MIGGVSGVYLGLIESLQYVIELLQYGVEGRVIQHPRL